MRAHELDQDGTILNTIEVESLGSLPGKTLVDASIGGSIDDRIIGGVVIPRPMPQPTIGERRAAIQAQIVDLERISLMNRGSRELSLVSMFDIATRKAEIVKSEDPEDDRTTEEIRDELLTQTPAYVKFKALDDAIKVLRDQYNSLG